MDKKMILKFIKNLIENIFHKRELASLKAECDILAMAYEDLLSWADWVNLKTSELHMIKDALENRLFRETVYQFKLRMGYRETYKGLMAKIRIVLKKKGEIK